VLFRASTVRENAGRFGGLPPGRHFRREEDMQTVLDTEKAFAIIPKVQNFIVGYRVVMTDDSIYLVSKGQSGAANAIGSQFGLLGALFAGLYQRSKEKKTEAARAGKSLEQIISEDAKSVKLSYRSIERWQAKKGFFASGRNGTKPIYMWVAGVKHMVWLPKDAQLQAENVLTAKCPGRAA
jgi:hypothetical protein